MDWLKNFFIPIIELVFLFGIIGFLLYVTFRPLIRMWNKSWKFTLKYTIFRNKIPEKDVQWCMNAIDKGFKEEDVKMFLLKKGWTMETAREMTWIFRKIFIQMKGGKKDYGRQSERSNRKTETEELTDLTD